MKAETMIREATTRKKPEAGITMIETAMAAFVLIIGSIGMIGLIISSIATNNRNKMDSTQTMLATSIVEQINTTVIGSQSTSLKDCAGVTHTIGTIKGAGANLTGQNIDFSENIAADASKNDYHMDYELRTPCTPTNSTYEGTFDVRWRVDLVGDAAGTPTRTYLMTIGTKLKNHGEGNLHFALPVTMRVMSGN
jgi:hypothetical protein